MKKALWTGLCAIAVLSCAKEMQQPQSVPASEMAGAEAAPAVSTRQDNLSLLPGQAIIYASEQLSAQLMGGVSGGDALRKRSGELDYLVSHIGASSFQRLFPDAGEFEPRTRAEGLHRWYLVDFDRNVSIQDAMPLLEAIPGIQSVEPNYVIKENVSLNDPYWSQMWGQNNTQYPGYDVNCKPVWDQYTMGSPNVTVGVIDGGFQLEHPDLAANVASSGHYNYVRHTTNITQHFHGTHVAGTIGAVNNNARGVTGIAGGNASAGKPGVKLLSLQVFETNDDGSSSSASSFATAIKEAADRGAIISQNSWGHKFDFDDNGKVEGYELNYAKSAHENPERSFTQAVDYFNKYAGCDNNGNQLPSSPMKGGVVIFAAGNDDIPYGSPGNYDGCVSVGAININGSRASFSNYGDWVDICAPGVNVPSTYLSGQYVNMSGTSMACPHVSGVAALIVSYFGGQGFTADELRARLLNGAREINATHGSKPIGPIVDAMGSFQLNGSSGAPPKVNNVTVEPVGHNARVEFAGSKDAYAYLVMAATQKSALEDADYQNPASNIVFATKLASPSDEDGTVHSVVLAGLKPSTEYYFGVVAYSYDKKYSELSEVKQLTTAVNRKPTIQINDYPEGGFVFKHHQIVSLPVLCSDPDGDAITVQFDPRGSRATLESNNGSDELFNFKIMCPLVISPGTFQSLIRVTDEVGAATVTTVMFTVQPNQEPVQKAEFPMILLEDTDKQAELDLSEYITDPDDEPLTFRAYSANKDVATVDVTKEGLLTINAVSQGVCKVRVSAEDHDAARVESIITVLVRQPGTGEVFINGDTVLSKGNITVITGVEEAATTVRLISATGIVVWQISGNYSAANPLTVNLDNLAPGVYTLEVTYKGQVYTYTIVKR